MRSEYQKRGAKFKEIEITLSFSVLVQQFIQQPLNRNLKFYLSWSQIKIISSLQKLDRTLWESSGLSSSLKRTISAGKAFDGKFHSSISIQMNSSYNKWINTKVYSVQMINTFKLRSLMNRIQFWDFKVVSLPIIQSYCRRYISETGWREVSKMKKFKAEFFFRK